MGTGPEGLALIQSGIPLIDRTAGYGSRTAIVADEGELTYAQLLQASAEVASGLLGDSGDLHGNRVALLGQPGLDYVATLWGIWRAGGVAMPLSLRDTRDEHEFATEDAGAAILIGDPTHEDAVRDIAASLGLRYASTADLLESPVRRLPVVDTERPAMLLYTSGTTSRPKGVVLTHDNLQAQITSLVTAWGWTANDRILNALPLHHVHGIVNALLCALWVGARCEILPRFDAHQVWSRLSDGDLTLYMAVPTAYRALVDAWKAEPEKREHRTDGSACLRLMVSGSDKLDVATLKVWQEITGHVLLERYGMTEIGMALSNLVHGQRVPGSVGTPLPAIEVRIVELDARAMDETGEHRHGGLVEEEGRSGELQVRGPGVFMEYWRRPEATAVAFDDDGWFCTGDIVEVRNGVYYILGRASQDFAISGGENVSLREVEEVLSEHPDIVECTAVGVPDSYWGSAVSTAVILRDGARLTRDELRDWARNRLAPHKLPQALLVCESLPRTAVGKVIKPDVAKLFQQQGSRP